MLQALQRLRLRAVTWKRNKQGVRSTDIVAPYITQTPLQTQTPKQAVPR
jgi:hypothetical protein